MGDARKKGEIHQWMYDRVTLKVLLEHCGFVNVRQRDWNSSACETWNETGLDVSEGGGEYKSGSLYVEGERPDSEIPNGGGK